eukprot:1585852-Lingulodinium_polyedra.AAC.1
MPAEAVFKAPGSGKMYVSTGGIVTWMQDSQKQFTDKYVQMTIPGGTMASLAATKLGMPVDGQRFFWQLRTISAYTSV